VQAIKQYHFITVNTASGLFRETYSITATPPTTNSNYASWHIGITATPEEKVSMNQG